MSDNMADGSGEVWLVRHGETDWSAAGRHTGRTDLALTANGRQQAALLREKLAQRSFSLVLSSPLARAVETCKIAGYGDVAEVSGDLREWDYGEYEGLTSSQIREKVAGWTIWRDDPAGGETIGQVADRARRVISRIREVKGDVILFSHGHLLRVLCACWLGLTPDAGRLFELGTASISILGYEHETPVISLWNHNWCTASELLMGSQ
ncbi:MAG: histidine phosphatase family protein [Acidobacteriota bacterium]